MVGRGPPVAQGPKCGCATAAVGRGARRRGGAPPPVRRGATRPAGDSGPGLRRAAGQGRRSTAARLRRRGAGRRPAAGSAAPVRDVHRRRRGCRPGPAACRRRGGRARRGDRGTAPRPGWGPTRCRSCPRRRAPSGGSTARCRAGRSARPRRRARWPSRRRPRGPCGRCGGHRSSGLFGQVVVDHKARCPLTSMPRAAMSVATSTRDLALLEGRRGRRLRLGEGACRSGARRPPVKPEALQAPCERASSAPWLASGRRRARRADRVAGEEVVAAAACFSSRPTSRSSLLWRTSSAGDVTGATSTSTRTLVSSWLRSAWRSPRSRSGKSRRRSMAVPLLRGARLRMRLDGGRMKPMSSIRSASSSTTASKSVELQGALAHAGRCRRPGVATTMSTPGARDSSIVLAVHRRAADDERCRDTTPRTWP